MFANIVSYFSNPSSDSALPPKNCSKGNTEDWVFIDSSGHEMSKEAIELEGEEDADEPCDNLKPGTPVTDLNALDSSTFLDAFSLNIEDAWCITPPPCFTLNCPTKLEISPLENLLIEHPSMSVYGIIQCNKTPMRLDARKSKSIDSTPLVDCATQTDECKEGLDCYSLPVSNVEPTSGRDHSPGSRFWKNTILLNYDKVKGKEPLDLIENFKPSECASFYKERYKLRPSFIRRQNLYTLTQCSFGSRNRCVVKPFGEKCKRSL